MVEGVFILAGAMLASFAGLDLGRGRWGNGAFWLVLGVLFALGPVLPVRVAGCLVLVLVALDGFGLVRSSCPGEVVGRAPGVIWPLVVTPVVTLLAQFTGAKPAVTAVLGLGVGTVLGVLLALRVTRASWRELLEAGHGLNETLGPVSILPQLLASLGAVFALAGVGPWLAGWVPSGSAVLANCLGMVLLAGLTGNSFAAFPIIASGITVPLLIGRGGDPELCALLTLTVGASGTLVTPMAANFNLVPGALLEMRHPSRVIRWQAPVALGMLVLQMLVLWLAVGRG